MESIAKQRGLMIGRIDSILRILRRSPVQHRTYMSLVSGDRIDLGPGGIALQRMGDEWKLTNDRR